MPEIKSTLGYLQKGGVKFMIYGKRGVGKTPIIGTLKGKTLIIASESGLATLRTMSIDYIEMTTIAQMKDVTAFLRDPKNIAKYDNIAWDGVSFCSQTILSELKRVKSYNHDMKYYGDLATVMMPFIELIANDIKKNVVVTAWQTDVYAPNTEIITGQEPSTAGKAIGNYLMHFFDVTMHLALHTVACTQADGSVINQVLPYLQTKPANGIFARDRLNRLDLFEQADLSAIIYKLSQP